MKKVILIGDFGYFPDSLVYFREHGFDLYYVKMQNRLSHFKISDQLLKKLDFNVISGDNLKSVYPLLDNETLVLSGPTFFGEITSNLGVPGLVENYTEGVEILYQISKYNHDNECGAKCVRYFNGDSGFGTQKALEYFNEKMKYVDVMAFDNENLRDLFITNSSVVQEKQTMIAWLETPLKRYVIHNTGKIEKRFISLGRCLSVFDEIRKNKMKLPIKFFPIQSRDVNSIKLFLMKHNLTRKKLSYKLAGIGRPSSVNSHRKKFAKYESMAAFGVSHMHDAFWGSVEKFKADKDFYFSVSGQNFAFCATTPKELYYPFVNNPNKEACYMMYGIVPIISNAENPYYKRLLENKMAICVSSKQELADLLNMSEKTIQEYRDNIYNHIDMFTFDNVADKLMNLLN